MIDLSKIGLSAMLALLLQGTAFAETPELPSSMVWTTYGSSSSGYAHSVAIGNMLQNKYGVRLTAIPAQNDPARMMPLKAKRATYCNCGVTAYFATEGVGLFGQPDWGPQNFKLVMSAMGANGTGVATRGDAGIETIADLKGKRVPWVRAADALNVPMTAFLAFGGLTWDDVEKVEFSGFRGAWQALLNGQSDAAFATTLTPMAQQLASSPNGIHWFPLPHDDEGAWARLQKVAPYFIKHTATAGADVSPSNPWEGTAYPYPVLITPEGTSEKEVYSLVKAMVENHDDYKEGAPGASGWALKNQQLQWVIPYHAGAVKYFKEAGVWSPEADAHNERLNKRLSVINEAWLNYKEGNVPDDEETAKNQWMKQRAEALTNAGFNPVFES